MFGKEKEKKKDGNMPISLFQAIRDFVEKTEFIERYSISEPLPISVRDMTVLRKEAVKLTELMQYSSMAGAEKLSGNVQDIINLLSLLITTPSLFTQEDTGQVSAVLNNAIKARFILAFAAKENDMDYEHNPSYKAYLRDIKESLNKSVGILGSTDSALCAIFNRNSGIVYEMINEVEIEEGEQPNVVSEHKTESSDNCHTATASESESPAEQQGQSEKLQMMQQINTLTEELKEIRQTLCEKDSYIEELASNYDSLRGQYDSLSKQYIQVSSEKNMLSSNIDEVRQEIMAESRGGFNIPLIRFFVPDTENVSVPAVQTEKKKFFSFKKEKDKTLQVFNTNDTFYYEKNVLSTGTVIFLGNMPFFDDYGLYRDSKGHYYFARMDLFQKKRLTGDGIIELYLEDIDKQLLMNTYNEVSDIMELCKSFPKLSDALPNYYGFALKTLTQLVAEKKMNSNNLFSFRMYYIGFICKVFEFVKEQYDAVCSAVKYVSLLMWLYKSNGHTITNEGGWCAKIVNSLLSGNLNPAYDIILLLEDDIGCSDIGKKQIELLRKDAEHYADSFEFTIQDSDDLEHSEQEADTCEENTAEEKATSGPFLSPEPFKTVPDSNGIKLVFSKLSGGFPDISYYSVSNMAYAVQEFLALPSDEKRIGITQNGTNIYLIEMHSGALRFPFAEAGKREELTSKELEAIRYYEYALSSEIKTQSESQ